MSQHILPCFLPYVAEFKHYVLPYNCPFFIGCSPTSFFAKDNELPATEQYRRRLLIFGAVGTAVGLILPVSDHTLEGAIHIFGISFGV